jgi:hypothetical protein
MATDPQESRQESDNPADQLGLDQKTIEQMTPAPQPLYLPINDCLTGLQYSDDGSEAPDVEMHYSIKLEFANLHDYNAVLEHPDGQEIANTITQFMRENGYESLLNELARDANEFGAYSADEVGPNSLTPGTVTDLQIILDDLIPMLNETYGLNIDKATVNTSAQEVEGCGPSPWAVPKDIVENTHSGGTSTTVELDAYKPM